jgi:Regulator of ribonuclease activity B
MKTSKRNNSKRARIGDIVEIRTPSGLGYVQYTHDANPKLGELVRVFPGLYDIRPTDFAVLAGQKELYFIFYIMNYALRAGWAEVVSNQPIPQWAKDSPMMRHAAAHDDFGRVIRWRLINAASPLTPEELIRTPLLTELTPEQKRLSIHVIWPHKAMVRELARGWTPERAEELRLQDFVETAEQNANQVPGKRLSDEPMKHYLYFSKKSNAEEAGDRLRSRGFSVEVSKSAAKENWLVLATIAPPKTGEQIDDLRDELESLATRFGGDYDGWEAAIDSLPAKSGEFRRAVN